MLRNFYCLCNRFCAHEYEKNKDMGAAALAYKCMEVAYLRITYTSHGNIRRCRYELQAALQVIPSGIYYNLEDSWIVFIL